MDSSDLNLASIFTGYVLFKVPFYQRSYVWEEDKWSRFLEDMYYVSSNRKSYFLGSVILKQEQTKTGSADERIVIDGQQRFTTIMLFLKSFILKKPEFAGRFKNNFYLIDERVALEHSSNDIADFSEVMSLTDDKPVEKEKPSRIIQAYNYFQSNIDVDRLDYHQLISNLILIVIDLNQDDDEQMIFDTINSLSEPLTTGELLKNYFFKKETKSEYENSWRPVFEEDNETVEFWNKVATQGRQFKTNIDAFFNAMIQIKIHNKSIPGISSEYKFRIKRNDRLFHNYKALINDFKLDRKEIITEIIEYAKLFKTHLSIDVDKIVLPGAPCIERINFMIEHFDCSTMVPYILYVLKNVEDETERNEIYAILESYITRRVIAKSSNKNYSDLFAENLIGNNILTAQKLKEFLISKDDEQSLAMPSNELILEAVREREQNNKRSLAILYMLETRLRMGEPHSLSLFNYDTYSLEHIMPKKWFQNWEMLPEFDEQKRNHYIKTLGNHSLLNAKLNTSISNGNWQTKLNGNSKGNGIKKHAEGLITINDILSLDEWNENEILNRADWLAQKVNETWASYEEEKDNIIQAIGEKKRTTQKFSLNGGPALPMSSVVFQLVELYQKDHPESTFKELKNTFKDSFIGTRNRHRGLLCSEDVYNAWEATSKETRYKPTDNRKLRSADGVVFFVNTQWILDDFANIINLAESLGYQITEE